MKTFEKKQIEEELMDQYEQNYYALSRVAYKVTGDIDDTFDIIQEVFVRLLMRPEILMRIQNLRAYLFCCVHHEAINHLKHYGRQIPMEDNLLEWNITSHHIHANDTDGNSEDDIEYIKGLLHDTLSDCPQEIIEAFVDYVVLGYPLKELADRLGKKPNTLSQQFKRIRTKLTVLFHLFTVIYSLFF